MRYVPKKIREQFMPPWVLYEFKRKIERDVMVWENKSYNERPMLNKTDGDILKFRRYCTQFYPETAR